MWNYFRRALRSFQCSRRNFYGTSFDAEFTQTFGPTSNQVTEHTKLTSAHYHRYKDIIEYRVHLISVDIQSYNSFFNNEASMVDCVDASRIAVQATSATHFSLCAFFSFVPSLLCWNWWSGVTTVHGAWEFSHTKYQNSSISPVLIVPRNVLYQKLTLVYWKSNLCNHQKIEISPQPLLLPKVATCS